MSSPTHDEQVSALLAAWKRDTLVLGLGSQKQQIERRFTSMKETRLNKLYAALALLLVCAMALGASVIFTACVPAEATAADPRDALTPLTERIVRYHYDLAPEDEITIEMLEGITSLKLSVSAVKVAALDDQTLVNFTTNYIGAAEGSVDALLAGVEFHQMVPKRFFEETIIKNVPETEFQRKKVEAFYTLVDLDAFEHEREKAEKKLMYPGIENCPCYIFDPTAREADLNTIFTYLHDAGILAPQLLDSTVIDTAPIYAAFPNLTTLELVGLTTVTPTTAGLTPLVDRIVRYYYNLGPNDIITDEMLAGVTSIKLEVSSIDTNIESLLVESMEQDKTLTLEMMELPADSSESLIESMKKFIASSNDASAKRAEQRIELGEVLEEKTLVSFNVNYADAAEGSYEALAGNVETFKLIPQRFFEKAMLAQVTDDWTQKKIMAYYVLKDNIRMESERAKAEFFAMFPGIDKQPTYIADPLPTTYDHLTIYYHFYEYGILDPQLLDSTAIDTAQFAVFPNLATLELVGLTEAK